MNTAFDSEFHQQKSALSAMSRLFTASFTQLNCGLASHLPLKSHPMKTTTTPFKPLSILVLSAKGWGTGSALRAFYIAEALKQRGHRVQFIKPLPTLPA